MRQISMTKLVTALILLSVLTLAACVSGDRSDRPPSSDILEPAQATAQPEITPTITPEESSFVTRTDPQIVIRTDRESYKEGESILVTVENNSITPIQFIKFCALRFCINYGDEWICEETECDGPIVLLDSGSKLEFQEEARSLPPDGLPETNSRYKFEYQIISEDPYYFAFSNEFLVQN